MKIRKTKLSEFDHIMKMYEAARQFMKEHGNPDQWGKTNPPPELIMDDIKNGNSYVCVENECIVATFFYHYGPDATYSEIYNGSWLSDSPYGVVHRITSSGSVKGAASFCLQWALDQCGNIRIDTHRDNFVMQNMLAKNGFARCGIIYIKDGSERIAYQKELKQD